MQQASMQVVSPQWGGPLEQASMQRRAWVQRLEQVDLRLQVEERDAEVQQPGQALAERQVLELQEAREQLFCWVPTMTQASPG